MAVDERLQKDKLKQYLLQCSLAGAVVFILLFLLDSVTQTVLIAALGSSAFIAFAMPRSVHSGPRHLVGGYVVGMLAGSVMWSLFDWLSLAPGALATAFLIVCGALAIAVAMFAMVVTRTEHPPAAALAIGLVFNEWDFLTLAGILAAVTGLSIAKRLVLPMLMDLL